jgi:uncharacterized membrane protein
MGENHFEALTTAAHVFVLLTAAIAYFIVQQSIIVADGPNSILKRAVGNDWKGKASLALDTLAVAEAFWMHWVSQLIHVSVAVIWLVPDLRIEPEINRTRTCP